MGLLVLAIACVAGCDGEQGGTWPTGPRSTVVTESPIGSSPSPSAITVDPPMLPEAATKPTRAGAEAFFRHFWDVYNYSFQVVDSSYIRDVSDQQCIYCNSVIDGVDKSRRLDQSYAGGRVDVSASVVAPGDIERGLFVSATLSQEAGITRDRNGGIVASQPPITARRVDAVVRWIHGGWLLMDVDVHKTKVA
ncbi:MAG: hypothetical protein GXX79_02915 [Actinomycetales bacterium]|nr:hypothetical protein [Actinomycetales bacterium]